MNTADRPSPPASGRIERLVTLNACALVVFTSWAFGGQAPWVREVLAWWGAPAALLFALACRRSAGVAASRGRVHPALRFLWPLVVYNLVVGAGCLNPSFREAVIGGQPALVLGNPIPWLPSSARPALALREQWLTDTIILAAFSLYLVLSGRRAVRRVLLALGVNAAVLAIFGTFQKLVGAPGLWFGLVPSPNARFFSTFIYHNHWGAFTLLNLACCLALLFHHLRRGGHRDAWHSPVLLGAVAVLLLAATIPLSASRSSTALAALLLFGAFLHFLLRLIRRRRERGESALPPALALIAAAALATAAIAYLGRDVIAQRARLTEEQLAHIAREDRLNSRLALYRDTWRMAAARPWCGWGLESYAYVFRIFNTQRAPETWVWIPYYAEAHNDWLQSLAETGFVGTASLVLLLALPLASIRWRRVISTVPRYLLAGVGLVLLYAWVEFPLANPAVVLTLAFAFACAVRYAALDLQAQEEEA
jgi:O-antigen ligase